MKYDYYFSDYVHGGKYIEAVTKSGEPYADVTLNISDYETLKEDEIAIPCYKLSNKDVVTFIMELELKPSRRIKIGPFGSEVLICKLSEDTLKKCSPLEIRR